MGLDSTKNNLINYIQRMKDARCETNIQIKLMHILGHFPLSMFKKAHNVSEADSPSVIR
jgi:hypothetical protein